MNKKKKILFCVIALLLLCVVIISVVFLLKTNTKKKNLFNSIKTEWDNSIPENQPSFLTLLDEKASFKYKKCKSEGKGFYTVTLVVSSPDISQSLKDYQSSVKNQKTTVNDMEKQLCELINTAKIKTTEQTVSVIVDEDNNYHTQFSEEFANAMFGYAYTDSMQTFMDEQTNAMKGE